MSGVLGPNDPTEQDIFDDVYRLVMLGVMRERDALQETTEVGVAGPAFFKEEEDNALMYLLKQNPQVVADAYVGLVRRYVELEFQAEKLRRQIDEQEDDE